MTPSWVLKGVHAGKRNPTLPPTSQPGPLKRLKKPAALLDDGVTFVLNIVICELKLGFQPNEVLHWIAVAEGRRGATHPEMRPSF